MQAGLVRCTGRQWMQGSSWPAFNTIGDSTQVTAPPVLRAAQIELFHHAPKAPQGAQSKANCCSLGTCVINVAWSVDGRSFYAYSDVTGLPRVQRVTSGDLLDLWIPLEDPSDVELHLLLQARAQSPCNGPGPDGA